MKRKKHEEHVNHERWLVSYADFITLLFAFFVVMFAISQADLAKFKKVSESMKKAFSAESPSGVTDTNGSGNGSPLGTSLTIPDVPKGGRAIDLPSGKTNTAADSDPELQSLKEHLEETISLEVGATSLSERPALVYDPQGLIVRLAVKDFFEPGKAEVAQDLRPLLDRIGVILGRSQRMIRVEGHTDATESSSEFSSDWELSSARASWVARYWISRKIMNPKNLAVAGYSHYRPIEGEASEKWGQRANRRVEFIILNRTQ